MAIFVNKHGNTKYLTGNKISDVLCSIARTVHTDLCEDKIERFSLHSGQVWALVHLGEAGMTPDFMKSRLHWMGESYRLYLWDTSILQQKHVNALKKDSDNLLRLLGRNPDILPNIVLEDNKMGEYLSHLILSSLFFFLFLFFIFFFCMLASHNGVVA
jgi:hypothetical protein